MLVAVDFSRESYFALRYALAIAPNAQIVVLYVAQRPSRADKMHSCGTAYNAARLVQAHAKILKQLSEFAGEAELDRHLISNVVRFGPSDTALPAYAKCMQADLIVMASTYPERQWFGSRARVLWKLVRATACDVLVLYPTDGF